MYRLVIIDDEKEIANGISNLFPWEKIGFQVAAVFSDSRKALDYIKANEVDVVLSDIKMPGIDGVELARTLQNEQGIRIVFFSSYQNYDYFHSAIKYHIADYLLKPIKYDELVNCFAELREKLDAERNQTDESSRQSNYDKIVASVKKYVQGNYQKASLEQAAAGVCLSASYLSKIFKDYAGTSFSEYLMKVRMEKACGFLDDIHYKMYEIAYLIGYDNPKNFSRAFRNYYGISPIEYRNKKLRER